MFPSMSLPRGRPYFIQLSTFLDSIPGPLNGTKGKENHTSTEVGTTLMDAILCVSRLGPLLSSTSLSPQPCLRPQRRNRCCQINVTLQLLGVVMLFLLYILIFLSLLSLWKRGPSFHPKEIPLPVQGTQPLCVLQNLTGSFCPRTSPQPLLVSFPSAPKCVQVW